MESQKREKQLQELDEWIKTNNEKNRQTYYGALNLANPELILEKYPKGNGEYTVDFVKQLMAKNPGKKLLLF